MDGGFGEWQKWSTCSVDCGTGIITRKRACDNPPPEGEGQDCSVLGNATEYKSCKIQDCHPGKYLFHIFMHLLVDLAPLNSQLKGCN